jgi:hypothetical protein
MNTSETRGKKKNGCWLLVVVVVKGWSLGILANALSLVVAVTSSSLNEIREIANALNILVPFW